MNLETTDAAFELMASWLHLGLEAIAAVMIGVGAVIGVSRFLRRSFTARASSSVSDRMVFARYLVWALEFQLASDILSTAVSPTMPKLTQLAVVAAIRIGLNFSVGREMAEERERTTHEQRRATA